eukprot:TRINITY_DN694_c1_g1_i2.p1 TRINITY_DN694_c1_g1~~TRINITY_DN694_c1_g1_i2.p1  ORF type:complete len:313 (+),score=53.46 TRINITY_DN694_c1_g1_i2:871-1809(+)
MNTGVFGRLAVLGLYHGFNSAAAAVASVRAWKVWGSIPAAFSFGKSLYELYQERSKKEKDLKRPNTKWETRNNVKVSDDLIHLPRVLLDEAFMLLNGYLVGPPIFLGPNGTPFDRCCVNIGPLLGKDTQVVQLRTLLRLAMHNGRQCCGCDAKIGLFDIARRYEVASCLFIGPDNGVTSRLSVVCDDCAEKWKGILCVSAPLFGLTATDWDESPLYHASSSSSRVDAVGSVMKNLEQLCDTLDVDREFVERILFAYPLRLGKKRGRGQEEPDEPRKVQKTSDDEEDDMGVVELQPVEGGVNISIRSDESEGL